MNASVLLFPALLLAASGPLMAAFEDRNADPAALPEVPPEFEITLFAREPLVRNPCSMAFDARGRLFVSMGPQYRNPAPETPPDSVVIVRDTGGDGIADTTHPFATGFNCIQGLAWHGRDLWVANAPDLTVVRDLNGDDVADEYVRVFTDLGNIEHGLHGLNWAPDGRLYMSKGNSKGVAIHDWKKDEPGRVAPQPFRELWGVPGPPGAPDFPAPQTFSGDTYKSTYQDPRDDWGRMGGILRCDDMGANLEIFARGFRNPYGLGFDAHFDWLGVDQDQNEGDRIVMPFYGAEFGWSHGWSTHWTGENHLPTVPISGPVFQGSGTGVLFADCPSWPGHCRGVWIINDWLLKSTHLYRPAWQGALMQPQGGRWETLVSAGKSLYRPVDMAFGPDGALYITGWGSGYGVERDQTGAMTNEGRIFRLIPKAAGPLPLLSGKPAAEMNPAELIAEFNSLLPVRRIDAQDELSRRGASVEEALVAALQSGSLSGAQETWTLWAMARAGGGEAFFVRTAGDPAAAGNVRIQSLRILGFRRSPALGEVLPSGLTSPEPRVRFAAVQAVHQAKAAALLPALTAHAAVEKDRVTWFATWRALRDLGGATALRPLLADARAPVRCAALLGLLDLKAIQPADLQPLSRDPDQEVRQVALLGLGQSPATPPESAETSPGAYPLAANVRAESDRNYAGGTLRSGQPSYTDRPYAFQQVPGLIDGAFMLRTANEDDNSAGRSFLTFDLTIAATVMVAHDTRLKERPPWLQEFSDTDLTIANGDTEFHLWSKEFPAGKVTLGGNLAGPVTTGKANYFVVILPKPAAPQAMPTTVEESRAALAKANPERGAALFFHTAACATCHRAGGRGINFGPDLTNAGSRMDATALIQSMLAPNAVITEGFAAHSIEADGKPYFGILLSTGRVLKLGLAGGRTVEIPAESVTKHETLPVSPMPPQGVLLPPQDVADIAAWLLSQKAEPELTAPGGGMATLSAVTKADRLILMQENAAIGEFVFNDPIVRRPFFANLLAPGGIPVTRAYPPQEGSDPTDHADMHPGLWLGFGDLAGEDFWRNKGTIRHDQFTELPAWRDGGLQFATTSTLLRSGGAPLAVMINHFTVTPGAHTRTIVWDAAITPTVDGFYFGDQEEMGLGARVATALTEKNGGLITSSTGTATAAKTWGQSAAWCDYSGISNGRHAGIIIVPDPANPSPSWWHNRDYGVFVANAFGRSALKQGAPSRLEVKRGETCRLRYSIIIHSSPGTEAPGPAALVKELIDHKPALR